MKIWKCKQCQLSTTGGGLARHQRTFGHSGRELKGEYESQAEYAQMSWVKVGLYKKIPGAWSFVGPLDPGVFPFALLEPHKVINVKQRRREVIKSIKSQGGWLSPDGFYLVLRMPMPATIAAASTMIPDFARVGV